MVCEALDKILVFGVRESEFFLIAVLFMSEGVDFGLVVPREAEHFLLLLIQTRMQFFDSCLLLLHIFVEPVGLVVESLSDFLDFLVFVDVIGCSLVLDLLQFFPILFL